MPGRNRPKHEGPSHEMGTGSNGERGDDGHAEIDDGTGPQPLAEHDRQAQPVDVEEPPRLGFPVVGIGASAGGLESIMEFFSAMRPDSGMAFIIVQHLPPDRETMIPQILGKKTAMPVEQIEAGTQVEPDHVYVIRPGRTLTLRDGRLHLGEPLAKPMHSRPIDDFFKSLAEEQRERAIAVVMSGMGSNGAAGAQAVKAVGGLCVAQDPESAAYPSMPRHLIEAGYADYILRPKDMPEMLLGYAGHPYAKERGGLVDAALVRNQQHVREILAVLRTRTRHDFSGYKKPTLMRRIQRRMGLARVTKLGEYARILRQTPSEVSALADDLLIHVTGFFRDPQAWETLRERVIVPLIGGREAGSSVRAWVSACSSGEEAYTLAMLLVEECERIGKTLDIKVFATDTAERMLQNARHGIYPGGIEAEITPDRLERFFQRDDAVYRVRQDLRERVVFAPQNVLQDPPFSRLDIVTCRNLLIYLEPQLQHRVLALLHFGLREGGAMFLGTSETVGGLEDLFEPVDKKARIFKRIGPTRHGTVEFPLPRALAHPGEPAPVETASRTAPRLSVAQMTTRALLEHHTPAAVTIDRDYRIVYYHGNTTPFIAQPSGEPTRDLMALIRDPVRGAARAALHRAMSHNEPVTVEDGVVEVYPGHRHHIAVTASPIGSKTEPDLFVLSFQLREERPSEPLAGAPADRQESAEDLRRMRSELQSTIEELQTSNEELKAAHEEVVSTNEELQSMNEELETSREEMQSLNEELSTVNSQLQAKMEEYQAVTNDLASLLTSTDIAVLFLDTRFRIRRFTPQVKELLEVIATDVGRPLNDLARKFDDPTLLDEAQVVLERLTPSEREISVQGGRWFMRRLTAYRTADNRIDGVVVTFVETTARHRVEEALGRGEEQFRRAIEEAPIPVIMQAENGEVLQVSRAWSEMTGYTLLDIPVADAWLNLLPGESAAAVRSGLRDLFRGDVRTLNFEFPIRRRSGDDREWSFTASSPGVLPDGQRFIVGMGVDITSRKLAEREMRASTRAIEAASAMKDQFLANISHELRTPLSVILMWAKLLARNGVPAPEQGEAIETIVRSAESQRRLIEDLLDMTRISSGKLRIQLRPIDVNRVARSAIESARPLAEAKGLKLAAAYDEKVGTLTADPGRLEQVIWVLLSNAVKFTPEGGSVSLKVSGEPGWVTLVVSDTGIGITPEFQGRIFRPFVQEDEAAGTTPRTGLGLGLSIAKSLVEMHKGTISVASPGPGGGSTFTVRLPTTLSAMSESAEANPGAADGRSLSGMSVLLVEDNLDALRGFQMALEGAGAKVATAPSGKSALALFPGLKPDVIVSDVSMPEMTGIDLLKAVRDYETRHNMPRTGAIALTAMATNSDRAACAAAGFDEFVAKPVAPEHLVKKVGEVGR
jgi:two-component system CheB/CheR fusion protein